MTSEVAKENIHANDTSTKYVITIDQHIVFTTAFLVVLLYVAHLLVKFFRRENRKPVIPISTSSTSPTTNDNNSSSNIASTLTAATSQVEDNTEKQQPSQQPSQLSSITKNLFSNEGPELYNIEELKEMPQVKLVAILQRLKPAIQELFVKTNQYEQEIDIYIQKNVNLTKTNQNLKKINYTLAKAIRDAHMEEMYMLLDHLKTENEKMHLQILEQKMLNKRNSNNVSNNDSNKSSISTTIHEEMQQQQQQMMTTFAGLLNNLSESVKTSAQDQTMKLLLENNFKAVQLLLQTIMQQQQTIMQQTQAPAQPPAQPSPQPPAQPQEQESKPAPAAEAPKPAIQQIPNRFRNRLGKEAQAQTEKSASVLAAQQILKMQEEKKKQQEASSEHWPSSSSSSSSSDEDYDDEDEKKKQKPEPKKKTSSPVARVADSSDDNDSPASDYSSDELDDLPTKKTEKPSAQAPEPKQEDKPKSYVKRAPLVFNRRRQIPEEKSEQPPQDTSTSPATPPAAVEPVATQAPAAEEAPKTAPTIIAAPKGLMANKFRNRLSKEAQEMTENSASVVSAQQILKLLEEKKQQEELRKLEEEQKTTAEESVRRLETQLQKKSHTINILEKKVNLLTKTNFKLKNSNEDYAAIVMQKDDEVRDIQEITKHLAENLMIFKVQMKSVLYDASVDFRKMVGAIDTKMAAQSQKLLSMNTQLQKLKLKK